MTWSESDINFEHAVAELAERFPGEKIEIITAFDIANVGWECDSQGALITRDGVPELIIVDSTGSDSRPMPQQLQERVEEYRRLIVNTERVLERYREMQAEHVLQRLRGFAVEEPQPRDEMPEEHGKLEDETVFEIGGHEYTLQRVPGEGDEEYAARKSLLSDLQTSGGRLVRRVGDLTDEEMRLISEARVPADLDHEHNAVELPESVLKKLREMADEHPGEKLDLHGGLEDDVGKDDET